MKKATSELRTAFLGVAIVAALTPMLYLLLRFFVLGYGVVWLIALSIGVPSADRPKLRIFMAALIISLFLSLFAIAIPRSS